MHGLREESPNPFFQQEEKAAEERGLEAAYVLCPPCFLPKILFCFAPLSDCATGC